jgi:hypothetical protein
LKANQKVKLERIKVPTIMIILFSEYPNNQAFFGSVGIIKRGTIETMLSINKSRK